MSAGFCRDYGRGAARIDPLPTTQSEIGEM
jgi:hypothetical protein